jgi:hypothetical protein
MYAECVSPHKSCVPCAFKGLGPGVDTTEIKTGPPTRSDFHECSWNPKLLSLISRLPLEFNCRSISGGHDRPQLRLEIAAVIDRPYRQIVMTGGLTLTPKAT